MHGQPYDQSSRVDLPCVDDLASACCNSQASYNLPKMVHQKFNLTADAVVNLKEGNDLRNRFILRIAPSPRAREPTPQPDNNMVQFKQDHIVIISPGSRYVSAQVGVGESPTPPRFRIPSRMFPTDDLEVWDPVKVRVKRRVKKPEVVNSGIATNATTINGEHSNVSDVNVTDGPAPTDNPTVVANGTDGVGNEANRPQHIEYEEYLEEDPDSDEGAEWPIEQGVIVNMPCFLALMQHVWRLLNPPFHSPAIVIAQPVWSMRDYEQITRLAFQNWNVPALHITDSGLMGLYGVGLESGLTVDIGYDKADITPVLQSNIDQMARRFSLKGCGGNSMTKILQQRLKNQGFDEDMAEQLKKSNICEILPIGTSLPSSEVKVSNPAAAASTGATASGVNAKEADGMRPGQTPRGPGAGTEVGEGDDDDNEGVLDVASIVARDNAAELLAKREQEKAAKAAAKKGGVQDAPKQVRLKNSEKEKATFTYKESITDDGSIKNLDEKSRLRKREIEVGIERFMAAESINDGDMGILETIAWNIYNTIMAVQNISARPMLWDNILVCGNGSRIKGKLINQSHRIELI
jgi:actin-related protein 9